MHRRAAPARLAGRTAADRRRRQRAAATTAPTASPRAAPDVVLVRSDDEHRLRGRLQPRRRQRDRRVHRVRSTATPAPTRPGSRAAVDVLRAEPSASARSRARCSTGTARRSTSSAGTSNFAGQGYKPDAGLVDDGSHDRGPRRAVLHRVGGGHPRRRVPRRSAASTSSYFMFFEDVDLGWRMNLARLPGSLRARPRWCSTSTTRRSPSSAPSASSTCWRATALLTIYKNFGDETLAKALAPALLLVDPQRRSRSAATTRTRSTSSARRAATTSEQLAVTKSDAGRRPTRSTFLMRHLEEIDAKRTRRAGGRRPHATRDRAAVRRPAAAHQPGARATTAAWQACVEAFGLDRTAAAPTAGPDRHRRHADDPDGRPGDPGLAHRRASCRRSTT